MTDELDQLVKKFVEESLSIDEQLRLTEILKSDPQARQYFLIYSNTEALLRSNELVISSQNQNDLDIPISIDSACLETQEKTKKKPKPLFIISLVAALLFSIVLGIYVINMERKVNNKISDPDKIQTLSEMGLSAGERLTSGSEEIRFKTESGSVFSLLPGSELKLIKTSALSNEFFLEGGLHGEVLKGLGETLKVHSENGTSIEVLGTKFRFITGERSHLKVDDGKVKMFNSKQSVVVSAGEMGLRNDTGIKLSKTAMFRVKKLEIIKAEIGQGQDWLDITELLNKYAQKDSRLILINHLQKLEPIKSFKFNKGSLRVSYKLDGIERNELIPLEKESYKLILPGLKNGQKNKSLESIISGFAGDLQGTVSSKSSDSLEIKVTKIDSTLGDLNKVDNLDLMIGITIKFITLISPEAHKDKMTNVRKRYIEQHSSSKNALIDLIAELKIGNRVRVKALHLNGNQLVISSLAKEEN